MESVNERHTVYCHDGKGNLKSKCEVLLPRDGAGRDEERRIAVYQATSDPNSFYTLVNEDRRPFSASPVRESFSSMGWRGEPGECVPEWEVT